MSKPKKPKKMSTIRGTAAERAAWNDLAWRRRTSLNKLVRQLLAAELAKETTRRRRRA